VYILRGMHGAEEQSSMISMQNNEKLTALCIAISLTQ